MNRMRWKYFSSWTTTLYDVIRMWNGASRVYICFDVQNCRRICRSLADPQYGRTFKSGANLVTSCCHWCRVEFGATIRNGPQMSFWDARNERNEID